MRIWQKVATMIGGEPIEVIEAWRLGFCLGNAVKYIARAGRKGDAVEDLEKAAWYLAREIAKLKRRVSNQDARKRLEKTFKDPLR